MQKEEKPSQPQKTLPKAKSTKQIVEDKVHIPRNVNFYLHFLKHQEITENDIEWVLQLRHQDQSKMLERLAKIPNQPFSLVDKRTIVSEKKHDPQDIQLKDNSASFMHLLSHRLGQSASSGLAEFETGLRNYSKDQGLKQKEKGWWYIPKKDRHDFPEFPKPIKEQKDLKKSFTTGKFNPMKLTYSAFEGMQNLPPYTMKFQQGNCGSVKHLFAPDVRMSQGQWEEGLRASYNKRLPKPASDEKKTIKKLVGNTNKK